MMIEMPFAIIFTILSPLKAHYNQLLGVEVKTSTPVMRCCLEECDNVSVTS